MSQPTLKTSRLELVPLNDSPEHKQLILELDTDAEVMRYIAFGRPFDEKESEMVRQHLLKTADQSGVGCWVARIKAPAESEPDLVGWWVLCPSETNPKRAEFGLRIVREFWGKGFAKEGTKALLGYSFDDLDLDEVFGETMTINSGSRKTMESCGMKFVRTYFNEYKDFTPAPGIEHGEVEYAMKKGEWEALTNVGQESVTDVQSKDASNSTISEPSQQTRTIGKTKSGFMSRKLRRVLFKHKYQGVGSSAKAAGYRVFQVGPSPLPGYQLGRLAMYGGYKPCSLRR